MAGTSRVPVQIAAGCSCRSRAAASVSRCGRSGSKFTYAPRAISAVTDASSSRVTQLGVKPGETDATTAKTQDEFSKWNVNLSRLQNLTPKDSLYLAFSGQWATSNLDPSEKMIAGGPYTVRAYDMGAVSGDTGYLVTAEFRRALGSAWRSQWQAVAFIDHAHVTINKTAWSTGTNSATLSGTGVGLNWAGPQQWNARIYLATRIGSTPVLVGSTASARAWIEISRGF